jgi:hypothetical protein
MPPPHIRKRKQDARRAAQLRWEIDRERRYREERTRALQSRRARGRAHIEDIYPSLPPSLSGAPPLRPAFAPPVRRVVPTARPTAPQGITAEELMQFADQPAGGPGLGGLQKQRWEDVKKYWWATEAASSLGLAAGDVLRRQAPEYRGGVPQDREELLQRYIQYPGLAMGDILGGYALGGQGEGEAERQAAAAAAVRGIRDRPISETAGMLHDVYESRPMDQQIVAQMMADPLTYTPLAPAAKGGLTAARLAVKAPLMPRVYKGLSVGRYGVGGKPPLLAPKSSVGARAERLGRLAAASGLRGAELALTPVAAAEIAAGQAIAKGIGWGAGRIGTGAGKIGSAISGAYRRVNPYASYRFLPTDATDPASLIKEWWGPRPKPGGLEDLQDPVDLAGVNEQIGEVQRRRFRWYQETIPGNKAWDGEEVAEAAAQKRSDAEEYLEVLQAVKEEMESGVKPIRTASVKRPSVQETVPPEVVPEVQPEVVPEVQPEVVPEVQPEVVPEVQPGVGAARIPVTPSAPRAGMTRLYRVDKDEWALPRTPEDEARWRRALGEDIYAKSIREQGALFTDDIQNLVNYGHGEPGYTTYFVDIPTAKARAAGRQTFIGNDPKQPMTEYLLDAADIAKKQVVPTTAAPTPATPTVSVPPTVGRSITEEFQDGINAGSVFEGGEVRPDLNYSWRSMGPVEYNKIMKGQSFGGPAQKGGFWSWFPKYSANLTGTPKRPKYLVEVEIASERESLTRAGTIKDVRAVWKSESKGSWIPEAFSREAPAPTVVPIRATPTTTAAPGASIPPRNAEELLIAIERAPEEVVDEAVALAAADLYQVRGSNANGWMVYYRRPGPHGYVMVGSSQHHLGGSSIRRGKKGKVNAEQFGLWHMRKAITDVMEGRSRSLGEAYEPLIRTGKFDSPPRVTGAGPDDAGVPPGGRGADEVIEEVLDDAGVPPGGRGADEVIEEVLDDAVVPPAPRISAAPLSADDAETIVSNARMQAEAAGMNPPAGGGGDPPIGIGGEGLEFPEDAGKAGNINLNKFHEDIHPWLKQYSEENADLLREVTRAGRSDAVVQADAESMISSLGGKLPKWKPGQAFNDAELLAVRALLAQKAGIVRQRGIALARNAKTGDVSSRDYLEFYLAMQDAGRVQQIAAGASAEAGRALRSLRKEAFDALAANDAQKMEEILRRMAATKRLGGLDHKKMAVMFAEEIDAGRLTLDNPYQVMNFLNSFTKPGAMDYVLEIWVNSILSGPKTHLINTISNVITTLTAPVERGLAAGVEFGMARLGGRQRERFFGEVPADLFGAFAGLREGVRAGLETFRWGVNPTAASKWEFRASAFKGIKGRIIRFPGTALEAADAFFYEVNFRAALNANAYRQAKMEGKLGAGRVERIAELLGNPTQKMIKTAQETAEYRLFRNDPGDFANWIMRGRTKWPVLRFVIPFMRTPVNIFKFGMARSPLGVANPALYRSPLEGAALRSPLAGGRLRSPITGLRGNIRSPVAATAENADRIGRIALGGIIAGSVAGLVAQGVITGAPPEGKKARDMFYAQGKQPYSIKIGNKWVSWRRLEPINATLLQITSLYDAWQYKDADIGEKAGMVAANIAMSTTSLPYMTGLSSVLNAITQPGRYGSNYFNRYAASIGTPYSAALRTGAQMIDPTIRRPTTLGQHFMAGIPGLTRFVPPIIAPTGVPAEREYPWSPIQVGTEQPNWIFDTLNELGIDIGSVGKSIDNVPLTQAQHVEYQRTVGKAAMADLEVLIASPRFRNSSREDKITRIEYVIRKAKLMVRKRFAATGQFKPSSSGRQRTEDWTETPGTSGVGAQRFGR